MQLLKLVGWGNRIEKDYTFCSNVLVLSSVTNSTMLIRNFRIKPLAQWSHTPKYFLPPACSLTTGLATRTLQRCFPGIKLKSLWHSLIMSSSKSSPALQECNNCFSSFKPSVLSHTSVLFCFTVSSNQSGLCGHKLTAFLPVSALHPRPVEPPLAPSESFQHFQWVAMAPVKLQIPESLPKPTEAVC